MIRVRQEETNGKVADAMSVLDVQEEKDAREREKIIAAALDR